MKPDTAVPLDTERLADLIRREGDQCVKCGLCLPHCPTYGLSRDEGESPRGRIALIQAMAAGSLPAEGRLAAHVDRCLGCRACERVCPSRVSYGRLLEAGRELIAGAAGPRPQTGGLAGFATRRMMTGGGLGRTTSTLLRLYQASGLQWLLRRTRLLDAVGLGRADRLLPRLGPPARLRTYHPPSGTHRGDIGLFVGCLGPTFEASALRAAVDLLNAAGYGVHVPAAQACCGAMHRHAGDAAGAGALARQNVDAFNALDIEAIAWVASGCGAALSEYAAWEFGGDEDLPAFRAGPVELCTLLERIGVGELVAFRAIGGGSLGYASLTQPTDDGAGLRGDAPSPADAGSHADDTDTRTRESIRHDAGVPAETRASIRNDAGVPAETRASIRNDAGLPTETRASVRNDAGLPAETRASVRNDAGLPAETRASARNGVIPTGARVHAGADGPPDTVRVFVHEPCSLRNVVRATEPAYRLLRLIPGLSVEPLPGNGRCCGGAGAYLMEQPEVADDLRAAKADIVCEARPDIIVTSNTGCAIQLSAAVREAGLTTRVIHPAVLLAEQLKQKVAKRRLF